MRKYIAKKIVRLSSECMNESYIAYCYKDDKASKFWAKMSRKIDKYLFPLAVMLNKEAFLKQVGDESWWG